MFNNFRCFSRSASRAAWIAASLCVAACTSKEGDNNNNEDTTVDGDTSTGDDGVTESSSSGDVVEPVAGCECKSGDPCDKLLCPIVAYNVDEEEGDSEDTGASAELDAALTCALAALRDGKTGRIDWSYYENGGQFDEYGTIILFGDGTARSSYGGWSDLCETTPPSVTFGPLEPSQTFGDCLAEPLVSERHQCIRGSLAAVTTTCQAGGENCGF